MKQFVVRGENSPNIFIIDASVSEKYEEDHKFFAEISLRMKTFSILKDCPMNMRQVVTSFILTRFQDFFVCE